MTYGSDSETSAPGTDHAGADSAALPPVPEGGQRILIWPHRSLGRNGTSVVMGVAAAGFAMVIAWIAAPAAWFVLFPAIIAFAALAFAFWLNTRRATRLEIVDITSDMIHVMTSYLGKHELVERFSPHWVRVELSDAFRIEKRLILSESGRAVSIGDCLSPPEREELASELRDQIARLRSRPA